MNHTISIALAAGLVVTTGTAIATTQHALAPADQRAAQIAATTAKDTDAETNDDSRETEKAGNESSEAASLRRLAKISASDAQSAAQRQFGGTARSTTLESENGSVVYSVIIGTKDVKVDAGTGRVLYADAANAESPQGARPKGSISAPDNDGENPKD